MQPLLEKAASQMREVIGVGLGGWYISTVGKPFILVVHV